MGALSTVVTGFKVWRVIKPYKRWKERRQRKREDKEETSERIETDTESEDGMKIKRYRKLIVMVLGGALTVGARFVPALEDADAGMLVDAVILGGTALGVWAAPNDDE